MFPILSVLRTAHKSIDRSLDSRKTREKAAASDDEADDAFIRELQAMNGAKVIDDVISAVMAKVAKIKESDDNVVAAAVKSSRRPAKKRLRRAEVADCEDNDAYEETPAENDNFEDGNDHDDDDDNDKDKDNDDDGVGAEKDAGGSEDDANDDESEIGGSEAEDNDGDAARTNVPWQPDVFMRVMRMAMTDTLTDGKPIPGDANGRVFANAALEAGQTETAAFWEDRDRVLSLSPLVRTLRSRVAGSMDFDIAETQRGPAEAELAASVFFVEHFYRLAKIRCCILFTTMLRTAPGLSGRTVGEVANSRAPEQLNMFADVHDQYLTHRAALVRAGKS